MKNGLFTTISSGKDRGAGHVNQLKQHQKLVFIERRFCLVGLQRNCLFWTLITQPNDQFCCLHWTTNEIKQCSWRKAARIDKSKRLYSIMTMQGHTYLWSLGKNYWSLVGMWQNIHHIVLTLITFCFDFYKTSWMVKISIMMMISNRTWFIFLLIKTRSFMNEGLWCCLKDGKRSLIKMGNTLQNKVI